MSDKKRLPARVIWSEYTTWGYWTKAVGGYRSTHDDGQDLIASWSDRDREKALAETWPVRCRVYYVKVTKEPPAVYFDHSVKEKWRCEVDKWKSMIDMKLQPSCSIQLKQAVGSPTVDPAIQKEMYLVSYGHPRRHAASASDPEMVLRRREVEFDPTKLALPTPMVMTNSPVVRVRAVDAPTILLPEGDDEEELDLAPIMGALIKKVP